MSQKFSDSDQQYMSQAIELAKQGVYTTKPNPNVGCVLVKNEQVVGVGFHPRAGQPHAEVFALRMAEQEAEGATAYVTLEPCAHYGKTPPCAEALIKANVAKVIIANLDPNPLVAGQGIALLQNAGISVEAGLLADQAQALNQGFLKFMATGMPYVRLKVASSLDGRTAMASGESKWITGVEARQDVQHFRAISGAVITGIDTVLADDCQLNVRELGEIDIHSVVQPKRVILDRQGRLPTTAKILQCPDQVIVMTPMREDLKALGVIQLEVQPLSHLLQVLAQEYHLYDILVEAGATLSTAFLTANLVDEFIHYIAPTLLGQSAKAMFQEDFTSLLEQKKFSVLDTAQVGSDLRVRLTPIDHVI